VLLLDRRMAGRRKALVWSGVLLIAVVGIGIGWYRSWPGDEHRFTSCRMDGDDAVLAFEYGDNQEVTATSDSTDDGVVVSLHIRNGHGGADDIGLTGEFRVSMFGATELRYSSGDRVDCGNDASG